MSGSRSVIRRLLDAHRPPVVVDARGFLQRLQHVEAGLSSALHAIRLAGRYEGEARRGWLERAESSLLHAQAELAFLSGLARQAGAPR